MKITLTGEESLRVEPVPGPLTIEAQSREQSYSPFHMFGSALGVCTTSVLHSWASNKDIAVDDLKVDISWTFVEGEHRIGSMKVVIDWPGLAAEMWPRAIRAANLCGVHKTFAHPPELSIESAGVQSAPREAAL